jgi:hypothetical protein
MQIWDGTITVRGFVYSIRASPVHRRRLGGKCPGTMVRLSTACSASVIRYRPLTPWVAGPLLVLGAPPRLTDSGDNCVVAGCSMTARDHAG